MSNSVRTKWEVSARWSSDEPIGFVVPFFTEQHARDFAAALTHSAKRVEISILSSTEEVAVWHASERVGEL